MLQARCEAHLCLCLLAIPAWLRLAAADCMVLFTTLPPAGQLWCPVHTARHSSPQPAPTLQSAQVDNSAILSTSQAFSQEQRSSFLLYSSQQRALTQF